MKFQNSVMIYILHNVQLSFKLFYLFIIRKTGIIDYFNSKFFIRIVNSEVISRE